MTKKARQSDSLPLPLLEWIKRSEAQRDTAPGEGSLNIERELRVSLTEAMKQSGLSAHQVAGEMSHLLGETITAEMIYSWTSESKNLHQIWGCRLPAFCRSVHSVKPLEILSRAAGAYCLPGPEALRAEIQHCYEQEKKAKAERLKRETVLKHMEGR